MQDIDGIIEWEQKKRRIEPTTATYFQTSSNTSIAEKFDWLCC